mgnify:FL=1
MRLGELMHDDDCDDMDLGQEEVFKKHVEKAPPEVAGRPSIDDF